MATPILRKEGFATLQALFSTLALIGKEARWVLAVEVNVTEHCGGAVVGPVVQFFHKAAAELQQCVAARRRWVLRPFALACQDRVILRFHVHRTFCRIPTQNKQQFMLKLDNIILSPLSRTIVSA